MQKDVTELLYAIKVDIATIESGDFDESLFSSVRSNFIEMMELIKLFLISERDSYYGYILMNMQYEVNFSGNFIAGIKLNSFPPIFAANPLLLCKFSLKEIIYIVCHEIDHIVLNHPVEMVKANPSQNPEVFYEFNLAADAAVNDRIDGEIVTENHLYMIRPEGTITSEVVGSMFEIENIRPRENYEYYFRLIEENKDNKKELPNPNQNGQQSMMNKLNSDNDDGLNGINNENDDEGKGVVTASNCKGKITDHNWEAGEDADEALAAVKELLNASYDMMNEETRGMMPGFFTSVIENINKPPKLSWQKVLKKYVGTISANKRKTKTRLNRRQPERFDLSGTVDDKILKIVVAIDTSGSMNNNMIAKVLNEIFAILAKRKFEITIIECDYEIQKVYKAKKPADIQNKVLGRGGTWFSPVIEYINENKYYRDALLIYFTDGYGENEIPKPMTYKNLWVVFGGAKHLSVKEPYGTVLDLE